MPIKQKRSNKNARWFSSETVIVVLLALLVVGLVLSQLMTWWILSNIQAVTESNSNLIIKNIRDPGKSMSLDVKSNKAYIPEAKLQFDFTSGKNSTPTYINEDPSNNNLRIVAAGYEMGDKSSCEYGYYDLLIGDGTDEKQADMDKIFTKKLADGRSLALYQPTKCKSLTESIIGRETVDFLKTAESY